MSQTKKALREALDEIALRFVSGNKIQIDSARISRSEWLLLQAALSLPETQGEPVAWVADAPDPAPESVDEPAAEASEQIIGSDGKAFPQTFDAQAWAKAFNETLTVLGHPKHDEGWLIGWFANAIMRGFDEAHWRAAPPSQPAHGWKLVPVEPPQLPPLTDAMYHAVRGLELEFSSGGPESVMASINDETLDEIWDAVNTALRTSKAMLAAPPSQPAQGWRLVPVEPTQAMMEAAAPFPEHLRAEHPNPDDPWHEGMFIATKCDQLAARTTYRAMLAAVPAAPTQAKPTNGEGA